MVASSRFLCRNGLQLHVLGLYGREDLHHPCTAFHALELLLPYNNTIPSHATPGPFIRKRTSLSLQLPCLG